MPWNKGMQSWNFTDLGHLHRWCFWGMSQNLSDVLICREKGIPPQRCGSHAEYMTVGSMPLDLDPTRLVAEMFSLCRTKNFILLAVLCGWKESHVPCGKLTGHAISCFTQLPYNPVTSQPWNTHDEVIHSWFICLSEGSAYLTWCPYWVRAEMEYLFRKVPVLTYEPWQPK